MHHSQLWVETQWILPGSGHPYTSLYHTPDDLFKVYFTFWSSPVCKQDLDSLVYHLFDQTLEQYLALSTHSIMIVFCGLQSEERGK